MSSYQIIEREEYRYKCLHSEYYSIRVLFKDKEYDLLVSRAGGFFNFEIFRKGIETIQGLNRKEMVKV